MAANDIEICNAALSRLGAPAITSLSDLDKRSQSCALIYPRTRDHLLRSHPWNFALKRVLLLPYAATVNYGTDEITVAAAPATGETVIFYSTSNGVPKPLYEGVEYYAINVNATTFKVASTKALALLGTAINLVDDVSLTSVYLGNPYAATVNYTSGIITVAAAPPTGTEISFFPISDSVQLPLEEGILYYVINIDATTFKVASTLALALLGTEITWNAPSLVTSFSYMVPPPFGYSSKFVLPTDYLRVFRLEFSDMEYKIEGGYLLCNESSVRMVYISKVTDVTKFEPMFDHLLGVMLAHELSYSLVQSASLKLALAQEVQILLRDVRSADAQEGTPDDFEFNTWVEARY